MWANCLAANGSPHAEGHIVGMRTQAWTQIPGSCNVSRYLGSLGTCLDFPSSWVANHILMHKVTGNLEPSSSSQPVYWLRRLIRQGAKANMDEEGHWVLPQPEPKCVFISRFGVCISDVNALATHLGARWLSVHNYQIITSLWFNVTVHIYVT